MTLSRRFAAFCVPFKWNFFSYMRLYYNRWANNDFLSIPTTKPPDTSGNV